ncbi:ABC transporter permease [Rhizobium herbae]|uniref:Spermidine/putrescine transport system permease protein n=1 Tax=Rhizobium herbae TaxID=508661 RepID=A0ABS4EG02_9HYPH|nr:hypothetical protein [Rhizobium herbae]MBP1856876.1 putative spermidine/putrescine transport system permease protein [Rhizobium herbae]
MIGKSLRIVFLAALFIYFALPLIMTVIFSLSRGQAGFGPDAYVALLSRGDLLAPLWMSAQLALATVACILLVMVPAVIAVHLFAPRLRMLLELAAILPFVIPGIALVAGLSVLISGPGWLIGSPFFLTLPYFFLALPYAYRAIDIAISNLDLAQLRLAAASLGAGVGRTILWVVMPNLWPALVNAALMTFTVVLGEFTVANILLFQTFPVSINLVGKSEPAEAAALTIVSFLLTWIALLIVLLVGRNSRKTFDPVQSGASS